MHATTHNSDPIFVAQVEALLQAANDHTAQGTLAYIEAGRMLRARKEHGKQDGTIPHGKVPWLERNFPDSSVTRLQQHKQVAEAIEGEAVCLVLGKWG
jgi:hypothetical protein